VGAAGELAPSSGGGRPRQDGCRWSMGMIAGPRQLRRRTVLGAAGTRGSMDTDATLFDGSPRRGLTAMAERRARWWSSAAPGGAGERTPVMDGVPSGQRVEAGWWLSSNGSSGIQRPCVRWRGTWKPMWWWARCERHQQLGSDQSELGAGAVGASSVLRHAEEKGEKRSGTRGKKGRREREGGV
jgi:hypothetical protein